MLERDRRNRDISKRKKEKSWGIQFLYLHLRSQQQYNAGAALLIGFVGQRLGTKGVRAKTKQEGVLGQLSLF